VGHVTYGIPWKKILKQICLLFLPVMKSVSVVLTALQLRSISPTCLLEALTSADHKSTKRQSSHQCLFVLLRSAVNFINVKRARFFVQIFRQSQNVTRKSCQKSLSYEKSAQKTLMELTPARKKAAHIMLVKSTPHLT